MDQVECFTLYNERKLVPRDKLSFRPSVYGIVLHENRVLLITVRSSGKLGLPGGAIELGERIEDALKREIREETGIEIAVERFARFAESFFYYDPLDQGMHSFLFYYICRPLTLDLAKDDQIDDAEASQVHWLPVDQLRRDDFQEYSKIVIDILQTER